MRQQMGMQTGAHQCFPDKGPLQEPSGTRGLLSRASQPRLIPSWVQRHPPLSPTSLVPGSHPTHRGHFKPAATAQKKCKTLFHRVKAC